MMILKWFHSLLGQFKCQLTFLISQLLVTFHSDAVITTLKRMLTKQKPQLDVDVVVVSQRIRARLHWLASIRFVGVYTGALHACKRTSLVSP